MRICKLLLGAPGAGKSTLARKIFSSAPMAGGMIGVIVSADHYFERSGTYIFDKEKLGAAHGYSWSEFTTALGKGYNLVIVDNTNVMFRDLNKYYEYANNLNYNVEILAVECPAEISAKRNIHNVPEETVKKMHQRFQGCLTKIRDKNLKHRVFKTGVLEDIETNGYEAQGI